jgi:tyrosyl-tRNA synthetase
MSWEELARGAVNIEVEPHLKAAVDSGRKLRVKFGIDPSAPDIHLGHTVVLRKLAQFQQAGHQAVLIIGDFTARIGDPSGRSETRKPLSADAVDANAQTYLEQVFKVLDRERTEVRHQSEWFGGMRLADVVALAGKATVAQILQRDDFAKRAAANQPIGMHELFYPLMQGYDSIAVESDLELGGTDQLYNLLFGRHLQKEAGMEPQDVLTMPLLEGLDGRQKMSKSLGNYVGVTDTPDDMFGKLMSVPDELITRYMRLVSEMAEENIQALEQEMADGANPRDAKAVLASSIVATYHGEEMTGPAREAFEAQFRRGELPREMPEVVVAAASFESVAAAIQEMGLAASRGQARRLVAQNGVTLNGTRVSDAEAAYAPVDGDTWQVGKRTFVRVRLR